MRAYLARFASVLVVVATTAVGAGSATAVHAADTRAPAAAPAAQTRPNILLVNTDDQRWDTMGVLPKTMNWMSAGVNYPNFQVSIPSCCPSRSNLFSGRYPHNNGVRIQANGPNLDWTATFPAYLKQAGYRTAMSGKVLTSFPANTAPPFFDRYATMQGGYLDWRAYVDGARRHIVRTDAAPRNYSTIWLGDKLREYLHGFEATDDTPWFAYYAPQAPHFVDPQKVAIPEPRYANAPVPTCLQPNEADRSDKPQYVRNLTYDATKYRTFCEAQLRSLMTVDDVMQDIMAQLQADGELANTLVVFTSDNGYLWGEHGRDAKFVPYLPSVKVPMFMRWDGHLTPGTDNRLALNVDIAPTLLQAAGITPPAGKPAFDGQSLLAPSTRTVTFTEYFQDSANGKMWTWSSLYNGTVHYIENINPTTGATVREYYNLVNDPLENLNLLGDGNAANDPPAAELNNWRNRLAFFRTAAGPSMVQ